MSCGDQSQRRREDRRAALRRKDPRRSANRREPAELLRPPKNSWDSFLKLPRTILAFSGNRFPFQVEAEFKDEIKFAGELDMFHSVISNCLSLLVQECTIKF